MLSLSLSMRILFFGHWEFLEHERTRNSWVRLLAVELARFGHEIVFFESDQHKIKEYDLVHVFSHTDTEGWPFISLEQQALVVTPALAEISPPQYSYIDKIGQMIIRGVRGVKFAKWPPWDEVQWFKSSKKFLILNPEWERYLILRWNVPKLRIQEIPKDPVQAAKIVHENYVKIREEIDLKRESSHDCTFNSTY